MAGSFTIRNGKVFRPYSMRINGQSVVTDKPICSTLKVIALTRDENSGDWGVLLKWHDRDGHEHTWVMPQAMLANGIKEVLSSLLAGGLRIECDCGSDVIDYIQSIEPARRVTIVKRIGWHDTSFVLPDEIISPKGTTTELAYAPDGRASSHLYGCSGSLTDWQESVSQYCTHNPRLLFAVALSFSGPTVTLLGEEPGGYNFVGSSSAGKTTALVVGGSIWGGGGKDGFLQSWSATGNALELVAQQHNDTCLFLDELGKLEAKFANTVPYNLAGGQAKNRMNADGSAQKKGTWTLQYLSSGELNVNQLAAGVGQRTRGGVEIRLISIPADAGKGLGLFEDLHGCANGSEFSQRLQTNGKQFYGTVGREFVRYLVDAPEACREHLRRLISRFEEKHTPAGATGEVLRAVRRFAVVAAAGELATFLDLTGWESGEAEVGVACCLNAWLLQRGTGANAGHDAEQMIRQVRKFLQLHSSSRFDTVVPGGKISFQQDSFTDGRRTYNRAGFVRAENDGVTYYFGTEVFAQEVCENYDHVAVLHALNARGFLVTDKRRLDKLVVVGKDRRRRFYAVREAILDANPSEEITGSPSVSGRATDGK